MSKAVLTIEMPERCLDCEFYYEFECAGECRLNSAFVDKQERPDWCPLRELPERNPSNPELKPGTYYKEDVYEVYKHGWNTCLDVIEGSD